MAIIYNIEDYREKKIRRQDEKDTLEQRIIKLALGQWDSEEDQINYMMEQAETDLEDWEKLYPIEDDIAE